VGPGAPGPRRRRCGKKTGAMCVIDYPTVCCASTERLFRWTQVGTKAPPLSSIGIKTVDLDQRFVEKRTDQWGVHGAWMETGSASQAGLATLSGTSWRDRPTWERRVW